jgi:hypothetical protein
MAWQGNNGCGDHADHNTDHNDGREHDNGNPLGTQGV